MNISKFFRGFPLFLAFLCFAIAAQAQTGSTGRPSTHIQDGYVCVDFNGVDSTLIKSTLYVEGVANPVPYTVFYDFYNNEVTIPDGAKIKADPCQDSLIISTTELSHSVFEMCDFDEATDSYTPFIRVFKIIKDLENQTITTTLEKDVTYEAADYTVVGVAGLGTCAAIENVDIVDKEYSTTCMVDVLADGSEVVFNRVLYHHDSTITDVDAAYSPYTIVGTIQFCSEKEVVSVEPLCDILTTDLEFEFDWSLEGQRVKGDRVPSSLLEIIQTVRNASFDCGQGQIITNLNWATCDCDYRNTPDGSYNIALSLDLVNGGSTVAFLGTVDIIDGEITRIPTNSDVNLNVDYSYPSIIYETTSFFRKFKQNGTFVDVDINNNPYSIAGEASVECDNANRYNMTHKTSTRPDMDLLPESQCWVRTTVATGNNWIIEDVVETANILFNGVGQGFPEYSNTDSDDVVFIDAFQERLIELGLTFSSVSVNKGNILIRGLDPSVTSVSLASGGVGSVEPDAGAISFELYEGDTLLNYNVFRSVSNGNVARVTDHYGNESALPSDATITDCTPAVVEKECAVEGIPDVIYAQDTFITYQAYELHALDINPRGPNVKVSIDGGDFVPYDISFANRWAVPECMMIAREIAIDFTGTQGYLTTLK